MWGEPQAGLRVRAVVSCPQALLSHWPPLFSTFSQAAVSWPSSWKGKTRWRCCSGLTRLPCVVFYFLASVILPREDSDWTSKFLSLVLGPITTAGWLTDQDGPGLTHMPPLWPRVVLSSRKALPTLTGQERSKAMIVHLQDQESFPKATRTCHRAQKGKVESNEVNLLLQLCWVCKTLLHRNASDMIAMEGLRGLKEEGKLGDLWLSSVLYF